MLHSTLQVEMPRKLIIYIIKFITIKTNIFSLPDAKPGENGLIGLLSSSVRRFVKDCM
jgi:hypothetical protein